MYSTDRQRSCQDNISFNCLFKVNIHKLAELLHVVRNIESDDLSFIITVIILSCYTNFEQFFVCQRIKKD